MIAYKITKARKDKQPIIHRREITKLSDIALANVSKNYISHPTLPGLDEKTKIKVLNN